MIITPPPQKDQLTFCLLDNGEVLESCDFKISKHLLFRLCKMAQHKKGKRLLVNSLKSLEKRMRDQKTIFNKIDTLTERELEIFECILNGSNNLEISQKLFISQKTVEGHRKKVTKKLNIKSIQDWIHYARILA